MLKNASKRILAVDLIRGYFLFVIIIDHLYRFFGFYELFTGGGTQWVSAAEGFFFISGIMIGLVRGRKLIAEPLSVAAKKVWSRAFQLYCWSVALTTSFTLLGLAFTGNPGLKLGGFRNESFGHFLSTTLTLRYNYGWADFLVYYILYLLFTPLALWLLRRGKWYILLGISFVIWLFSSNTQLGWQLLFFSGTIVGFYLYDIEGWFTRLSKTAKRILATAIITLGLSTLAISEFFNSIIYHMNNANPAQTFFGVTTADLFDLNKYYLSHIFDKYSLGAGRLIFFYIWFAMLYLVTRYYEKAINKVAGWFLIPLGQNSLYVYIVHAILLFILNLTLPPVIPIWANIVVNTLFLAAIWSLVRYRVLFKYIPR